MATEIYLGNPPLHVINWIKAHSKPVVKAETHIKFTDSTEGNYLIEGIMNDDTLIATGLMVNDWGQLYWITQPLEVNVGNAVTSIGTNAFLFCENLTGVTIPDSVTSISDSAFSGCKGLSNVTIPDSVTSIGGYAFSNCTGLSNVTIGNGVTHIGNGAFENCSGLTSVTIPDSVTSIQDYAFRDSGLTSVTFAGKDKATVQGMANYSWGLYSGCVIHCTDGDITI